MSRLLLTSLLTVLLSASESYGQSGAVIPEGGAGHASSASCIILKRMGPADQVTSHLYSFGLRGKQFQYVEGKLPDGFPFHGRLTDHDVRNLQGRGAEVIVLNPNFTSEDLKQGRADCRGETGKAPLQSEAVPPPAQSVSNPPTSAAITAAPTAGLMAKLQIESTPPNADIEVDGSFVGSTPSEIQLTDGDHSVVVKKSGFKEWNRKLKATAGSSVHVNAELEKVDNP